MISVKNITKKFGNNKVFENLSFEVACVKFLGIFGSSGCGKTTLLRVLAGLEKVNSGEIWVEGNKINKPNKSAIMIFQTFEQLFPWKTVLENITFPLLAQKIIKSKKEVVETAMQYLVDVELSHAKDKYPYQLSGGMKQRVALARALSLKPKVILMDEPFASLDILIRKKMQILAKKICNKYNITVIFVSHSVSEILYISDNILIFDRENNVKLIEKDIIAHKILSDFELDFIEDERVM